MTTLAELDAERVETLAQAKNVLAQIKSDNRSNLTALEQSALSSSMARVRELDSQIKGRQTIESIMGLSSAEQEYARENGGSSIFTSEAKSGLVSAMKSRSNFRCEVPSKALIGATGLLPTSGQGVVPGLHPGAMFPLASLFNTEPASGPSIRYYEMNGAVAAVVAEGAVKPDSGLAVTPRDALLVKIATVQVVSDELSDDAPGMIQYIGSELQNSVITAENAHIIGALTTAGILTAPATGATLLDVIADEIAAQTAATGIVPTAVVVAPSVLSTLRKMRGTSNDGYTFDPLSAAPASVHGVTLIPSVATPANTVWVLGSRAATMFRRGPITVEIGLSADDWVRNQTHLRAEERVVLAVQRPQMISKITVT